MKKIGEEKFSVLQLFENELLLQGQGSMRESCLKVGWMVPVDVSDLVMVCSCFSTFLTSSYHFVDISVQPLPIAKQLLECIRVQIVI